MAGAAACPGTPKCPSKPQEARRGRKHSPTWYQGNMALQTPKYQLSSLQNCDMINFYCFQSNTHIQRAKAKTNDLLFLILPILDLPGILVLHSQSGLSAFYNPSWHSICNAFSKTQHEAMCQAYVI